jgi:hypothetical protein
MQQCIQPGCGSIDIFAQSIDVGKEHVSFGARHKIAALVGKVFGSVTHCGA